MFPVIAPALDLQLRDRAPRIRRPGRGAPLGRRAHEDQAAGAAPVLDDARSGGERAAVPLGGRGVESDRGGSVPTGSELAVQGLPVQEQVLGVDVAGTSSKQRREAVKVREE